MEECDKENQQHDGFGSGTLNQLAAGGLMSPAYLFAYDARTYELRTDDERIPVPPGSEEPPVKEPPDGPVTGPDGPVEDPGPSEPERLRRAA